MSTTPPPPPPPPPGGDQGPPEHTGGPDSAGQGSTGPATGSGAAPGTGTGFPGSPDTAERNSLALTALILGLIAFPGVFVIAFLPLVQVLVIITPVVAIVAIVLGILGIRRAKRPTVDGGVGMSVTGIVLGAIHLLLVGIAIGAAVTFLRTCPLDLDASPEQATEQMLDCMAEQGWLGPGEMDRLEDQLDSEFNGS